jgi:uncharacterized protein (DUF362 family)
MTKKTNISRRDFIRLMMAYGISATAGSTILSLTGCDANELSELDTQPPTTNQLTTGATPTTQEADLVEEDITATPIKDAGAGKTDMAITRGSSPPALVRAAIAALGGIEAFVKPGDDVIIKPNIVAADYSFEYAAYTNPEVVGAVTELCVGAGAGLVRVMDLPVSGTCEQVYARSGIGDVVAAAGGQMEVMSKIKYRKAEIPEGRDLTSWSVYGEVLDADVFINVPIAKHHHLSKLTLTMKNLMGVIIDRGNFHPKLGQRLADLASLIRPTLTIVDAVNILMKHGPRGGNLSDVKQMNTVIASQDFIAAGAYATTFFGLTGSDIDALRIGADMGLGTLDLDSLRIEEISV